MNQNHRPLLIKLQDCVQPPLRPNAGHEGARQDRVPKIDGFPKLAIGRGSPAALQQDFMRFPVK